MDAVLTCLVEESLGHGEISRSFLKKFTGELGLLQGYGIREYPRALELVLRAAGAAPGERVALSVLSPAWYLPLVKSLGLEPVFLDVDPDFCTVKLPQEPAGAADIFLVHHHLGFESDLARIEESGLRIIEDISQVFASGLAAGASAVSERAAASGGSGVSGPGVSGAGASGPGASGIQSGPPPEKESERKRGWGLCYLDEEGFVTALGGAVVFSRDRKENQELRRLAEELDASQLFTDPQAAMGASQWNRMGKFIQRRTELREVFLGALQKSRNRTFMPAEERPHVPFSFPVLVKSGARDVIAYARKKKIACAMAFENSILVRHPELEGDFPGAKGLALRCVLFPLYPALSREDIEIISRVLSSLP